MNTFQFVVYADDGATMFAVCFDSAITLSRIYKQQKKTRTHVMAIQEFNKRHPERLEKAIESYQKGKKQ